MRCKYGIWCNQKHHLAAAFRGSAARIALVVIAASLSGCNRAMIRSLIDKIGKHDKAKPAVYHEYEGYSPGLRRSKAKEEFNRYYYYIAPDKDEFHHVEPEIYYRQDYEPIVAEPQEQFDESQYWRDHPLTLEGDPTPPQEAEE